MPQPAELVEPFGLRFRTMVPSGFPCRSPLARSPKGRWCKPRDRPAPALLCGPNPPATRVFGPL